jgi:hypothetical protein
MSDVLVKMAELADRLDEYGCFVQADKITDIMKVAKKKMDGNSSGADNEYLASAAERFQSVFDSFARRVEGPTARKQMVDAGIHGRKVAVILDKIDDSIKELSGIFSSKK